MRTMISLFTSLLVMLSFVASFAGVRSFGHDRYRTFTTARGETVEVQDIPSLSSRSYFICGGRCECLGEIVPTLGTGAMPTAAVGY